jgi:hypothetical protein
MTEADPQSDATYLGELSQLYHLNPIIGTNGTNEPPWFKAVGGAIGKANLAKLYAGAQPFAPTSGPAYKQYRSELAAVSHQVAQPASQWYSDSYTMACWDSFNLMALAAQAAKNTNPKVFRPWIVRLTQPSPGAVVVHDFAQGKQALLAGKKIQYVGAVGQISFDKYQNSLGLFEIIRPDGSVITTYTASQILAAK